MAPLSRAQKSTTKAVLDYKRKRRIINPSYQKTADTIVGKMTIAAMDKEMAAAEKRPPLRGCTTDCGGARLRQTYPPSQA